MPKKRVRLSDAAASATKDMVNPTDFDNGGGLPSDGAVSPSAHFARQFHLSALRLFLIFSATLQ